MDKTIMVKRKNGTIIPFDESKIKGAVTLSGLTIKKQVKEVFLNTLVSTVYNAIQKKYKDHLSDTVIITVEQIHELVIKTLYIMDKDIHKQYADYRDYKQRFSKSFENIKEDTMRIVYNGDKENANKDSSIISTQKELVAGVISQEMMLEWELPSDAKQKHKDGQIYIHDLRDHMFDSINCIDKDGWITFKDEKGVRYIQLKDLDSILNVEEGVNQVTKKCYVLGRNGWTRLKGVMKRPVKDEELMYNFKSRSGLNLKTTGKHRVPVIRDGKEVVLEARDIAKGDVLLTSNGASLNLQDISSSYLNLFESNSDFVNAVIVNIKKLKKFVEYKYDVSIQEILRSNGFEIDKNLRYLTSQQFIFLNNTIEIPYEVMHSLRVKAYNGKNDFPMLIPINESLAKLYGYIYADGGVYVNEEQSTYHLTFTNTNIDLIEDFVSCFDDCFETRLSILKPSGNSPCYRVVCGSKILVNIFSDFAGGGKTDAGDISMPDFIINGSKRIKLAYLSSSIDCDGYKSDSKIAYVTSSEKYSDQMVKLLSDLGYNPTKDIRYSKGTKYKVFDFVGVRNFDNFIINIQRDNEIFKLDKELNCFKTNDYYDRYEDKLSHNFINSKVLDIYTSNDGTFVYDLETESNWFIVNDYVVHNCCLFDLANTVKGGFELNGVQIEEPDTFETFMDLANDVMLVASSQQFGGFTYPEIDKVGAPYLRNTYHRFLNELLGYGIAEDVAKDKAYQKTWEICMKKCRMLEYKVNCVNNATGQTPFFSLSLGLDTDKFARMIAKAILTVRMEGIGKNKTTAIFPKIMFLHREDVNGSENSPNYDLKQLAIRCSCDNQYPDYISLDNGLLGDIYDRCGKAVTMMGCRAALSPWWDKDGEEQYVGRFNIGAVTMQLVRIALDSRGNEDKFFELLDECIDSGINFHLYKYAKMAKQKASSNPLFFTQGGCIIKCDPNGTIEAALECATASIGYIGLNEACVVLSGKELHHNVELAEKIMDRLRTRVDEAKAKHNRLFALYGTPSEGLCDKALKRDLQDCGLIEGVTDKAWYTNSHHVNVTAKISAVQKAEIEDILYQYPTGGRIFYTELPHTDNIEAIEQYINYCMRKGLYIGINFDNGKCNCCGYRGKFKTDTCPKCDSESVIVITRVCGYLGVLKANGETRYNHGKEEEVKNRFKHYNYIAECCL